MMQRGLEHKNASAQSWGDYHVDDGDSDEKAQQVSNDPELCKYLTKEQRAELVNRLFDGSTGADEDDAADELGDELDSEDLDKISNILFQPDLASNTPVNAAFDEFGITGADLEAETGLEIDELKQRVGEELDSMSDEELSELVDDLLSRKKE